MPQSLAQVYLHVVFSTKDRFAFLTDRSLREELHRYLGGASNNLNCPILRVGGTDDHIHLLCRLGRTISIADFVREIKHESSQWLKTKDTALEKFYWQNGYGAFSVSPSHIDRLIEYIEKQVEHHRHESFQDEYRRLLREHGLEWDDRYVGD